MRAAFLPVLLVLASIGTAAERPNIQSNNGLNMDYGPAISNSLTYRQKQEASAPRFPDTTERALILDLPGDAAVCYDTSDLRSQGTAPFG